MKIWFLSKHENVTTGKKYCRKQEKLLLRSNFTSFPQYFQYISNFKSPIIYIFVNVVVRIIFSSILQNWYVEVRISRRISERPLEFEITRVDCSCTDRQIKNCNRRTAFKWSFVKFRWSWSDCVYVCKFHIRDMLKYWKGRTYSEPSLKQYRLFSKMLSLKKLLW